MTVSKASADAARAMKIGVISDTHGLMRPEALDALRGADHIVHAGDIGGVHIIDALRKILVPALRQRGFTGSFPPSQDRERSH